ncbi:MAG TPA: J domain-containing protein, partial [Alphaproteobacteria bacterium]|nr:J domain-containing protein [Alphaproteobacteria bacterium]
PLPILGATMRAAKSRVPPLNDFTPKAEARRCDHPDCQAVGEFRAPRSRDRLNDYFWFCLDHVREYNKAWNYHAGLSDEEVERMIRYDTVWQRPTWPMGIHRLREARLRERAYREFGLGEDPAEARAEHKARGAEARRYRTEEEEAMAILDLDYPVDFQAIKTRYKALVKLHHPDANGGSREAEEKLKTINRAYSVLKASFAS